MVFCFAQNFVFGQHETLELEYLFFPEFNIRLYDKNSESDFLFLHKTEYFFSQHWESEYFFIKKNP